MRTSSPGAGYGWFLSLALVAALTSCARAEQEASHEPQRELVEVTAGVDRAVATTGDVITYRISVDAAENVELEFPEAGAEIAGFRIIDIGREGPTVGAGRRVETTWYELRADLVGSYVLPPVEIRYRFPGAAAQAGEDGWQTVATSEIFVEVESVLPAEGGATDIRGLKPLQEVPSRWSWREILLVAAALLLALASILGWRRWRKRPVSPEPLVPPHEIAFALLSELRQLDLDDPEMVRQFYFRISEGLRAYVEGRFGINATDLTTEEILGRLPEAEGLGSEGRGRLERFLVHTDVVKFGHHDPRSDEIEQTYEWALRFVETTQPSEDSEAVLVAERQEAA